MLQAIWLMLLALLFLGWGILYRLAGGRYEAEKQVKEKNFRFARYSPPMLFLLEKLRLTDRFPIVFYRIQRSVQILYGSSLAGTYTSIYLAELFSHFFLGLLAGCVLPIMMDGDVTGFGIGLVIAVLLPIAMVKELLQKVMKREQNILLELPELLNKIILLVNAGETVQKALQQCVERKRTETEHPLYKELIQMVYEWGNGYSFQQALERFSKRCSVQEISIFTTTVLLNYRRGGSDFVVALRELSRVLWEKRKAVSRTRGEEASTKMVFPMVMIFFIMLVLVCTPIFLMMNA